MTGTTTASGTPTTTSPPEPGGVAPQPDDRALKAKHRAMWASGDYPALAREVISELGPVLAAAAGTGPGQRVLDVAAGSGNAAVPAAVTGADVVACDLAPELFADGRRRAAEGGVGVTWVEADAEDLPFDDGEFDAVMSCVGVMFAPHHAASAAELLRVCRPGGTLALLSWTPAGFVGQLFATMKPYAPPPPAGAQPPPLWGDEAHVRALLGDGAEVLTAERRTLRVDRFAARGAFREYFASHYGPTISVYRAVAGDAARVAALDAALDDLAAGSTGADGAMEWEYLLLTARRSGAPASTGTATGTGTGTAPATS